MALPDFLIVGAMKCGTSTLAAQLGAQPGIFVTNPKEPNFFSDDDVFARGMGWYEYLFAAALPGDLLGEASTHYTKRPTYPECIDRLVDTLENVKLIYLIRNPVARTVSQYLHEWTMGQITYEIEAAIVARPELVRYSCYADQISPFVDRVGAQNVFISSLEAMNQSRQATLDSVCAFLGYEGVPQWKDTLDALNASADRYRQLPLHRLLIDSPIATKLRRTLVPQALRNHIRLRRQFSGRPELSLESTQRLQRIYAKDYEKLRDIFPDRADLDLAYPFVSR